MAFIDSKNQTAGSNTQQQSAAKETKPAVELAVFNLASVTHTEDHKFIAHQIQNIYSLRKYQPRTDQSKRQCSDSSQYLCIIRQCFRSDSICHRTQTS
jgi:hypothetical protein